MSKNIFVIRSDRLGEFLLSLPAIKNIKHNYPDSKVYLLAQKSNIDLIKGVDFIEEYIEYKPEKISGYFGAFKLAKILRKEKIDCLIALNPKKEFHLAARLAGVKLRVGYNRKFGFCLNKKIEDKKYQALKHEVEYNLDLIKLICKDVNVPKIELALDNPDTLKNLSGILDITEKYIIIHPFTSNPSKRIEENFWANLTGKLKNSCTKNIVIIGSEEEQKESMELAEKLGVKNLSGKLSLRNLASFLKYNCSIFIGLDSGPMHLASILNLPVVGLFRVSNAKRWGPLSTRSLIFESKSIDEFKHGVEDIVKFACVNIKGKI